MLTASEVVTWIAFGDTATREAIVAASHEQLELWQVRPMEHLREALVGRASPHPYCAVVPIRLPAGAQPVVTHYACKSVSPSGPALLRSIRAAARRRLGRLVSYPELLAMLEQDMQRESDGDATLDRATAALMDALRRGAITAYGIPSDAEGDARIGARHEPVPSTVLMGDNVTVDLFDQITIDSPGATSEWMRWRPNTYHRVRFQTADVLAIWPVQSPPPSVLLDDLPADWTLLEAVAWIMLRDPAVVRDTAPETARDAGTFYAEHRLPSGTRLTEQTGEPGNDLLRLIALWAAEKVENPGAVVWPGGDATKDLLAALRAGKLAARGKPSGGVVRPMVPADWRGLRLHEQPRGTLIAEPGRTMGQRWFDMTVPRSAVVALWPATGEAVVTAQPQPATPRGKPKLTTELLRAEFRLRVARWKASGAGYRPPSLADDIAWTGARFAEQAPRALMASIRRDLAPAEWTRPGPRRGEIWRE